MVGKTTASKLDKTQTAKGIKTMWYQWSGIDVAARPILFSDNMHEKQCQSVYAGNYKFYDIWHHTIFQKPTRDVCGHFWQSNRSKTCLAAWHLWCRCGRKWKSLPRSGFPHRGRLTLENLQECWNFILNPGLFFGNDFFSAKLLWKQFMSWLNSRLWYSRNFKWILCPLFEERIFFLFFFFCVCVWFYGRTFTLESCRSFMKEKPEGEWRFKKLVSWKHLEKNQRLGVWTLGVNETAFYGFCCKGLKIFCTISQEFSHHRRVLISLSPAGAHSLTAHLGALSSDRRTMPASALHQIAPNVPWCNEVSRFQAQLWEGICLFRNAALSHWNNIEMKPAAACVDAMADIVPTDA